MFAEGDFAYAPARLVPGIHEKGAIVVADHRLNCGYTCSLQFSKPLRCRTARKRLCESLAEFFGATGFGYDGGIDTDNVGKACDLFPALGYNTNPAVSCRIQTVERPKARTVPEASRTMWAV